MARYLAGRIGQAIFVVWLAYTLTFFAIAALPSDPITIHLSEISEGNSNIDPNLVEAMKAYYGYNQPLPWQYVHQLLELIQGDFGYSLSASLPVLERMRQVILPTLQLSGLAFAVAIVLTMLLVTIAALVPNEIVRRVARSAPTLFSSMPTFWFGIVALNLLSFKLHLISIFPDRSFLGLLVPAVVLGVPLSAGLTQVLLRKVDDIYAQPFVTVARAKGARAAYIFFRHVLKNAAPSALTMLGLIVGNLVTGAVVVETVFSRPGLGRVLQQAVSTQDVALIQGFVLLAALAFVTINLLVDLAYPLLDPRVVTVRRSSDPAKVVVPADISRAAEEKPS